MMRTIKWVTTGAAACTFEAVALMRVVQQPRPVVLALMAVLTVLVVYVVVGSILTIWRAR